jgi:hypothetical protein
MGIIPEMSDQYLMNRLSEYGKIVDFEYTKRIDNPPLPTKEELLRYLKNEPDDFEKSSFTDPVVTNMKIYNHVVDKNVIEIYHYPELISDEQIKLSKNNFYGLCIKYNFILIKI